MTYELKFNQKAHKEFLKLNPSVAEQFLQKLEAILQNPKIAKNKLRGAGNKNLYKIKLRSVGYRLAL